MAAAIETYEGREVLGVAVKLTNAGDGLSEAMTVEPVLLHHGDRVLLLVEATVTGIAYVPISRDWANGPQRRVQTLRAGAATIVEDSIAEKWLAEHKERVAADRAARDQVKGQTSIDDHDDDDLDDEGPSWASTPKD